MTKLLLCTCGNSQTIDADAVAAASGLELAGLHTALCEDELGVTAEALKAGDTIVACGQMASLFADLAEELDTAPPLCIDIRDRAGWGEGAAAPKMAALLADGLLAPPPARFMEVSSEGACLIIGDAEVAFPAAEALADYLAVTVLIPEAADTGPVPNGVQVVAGRIKSATGALGSFSVNFENLAEQKPIGRGALNFGPSRTGVSSVCDVILDLSGATPLFPAHHKRDGYLRPDPGNSGAVEAAIREASHLTGTFEKPFYIRFDESLCAHSRSNQTGCTRCLDICPTGAILPGGDTVEIDPLVCAGCGACAAVCPSGAASYDDPPVQHLFNRMRAMAETYRKAGAGAPHLLVHDGHGSEMIQLSARFGRGLPAHVIPMEISVLSGFGHAEMLAALGVGFAEVAILLGPKTERAVLEAQAKLAEAIADAPRVQLLDISDPDALSDALVATDAAPMTHSPILPLGGRREVTRLVGQALRGDAMVDLPEGAPYGAVLVDQEACTLCLACAGHCPSGALLDDEDHPRLRFREDACLQCGICSTICPENAITYEPRLDLSAGALEQQVVKEEEPFACIECGSLFGVKSTIERIVAKLEGNHAMFTNSDNTRLIRMCDDCRVSAQYHTDAAPFRGADRPMVRTTADYLKDEGEA